MPAPEQQSDKIAITGLASLLDRAKEGLLERVKELQAEQEDRVSICWCTKIYQSWRLVCVEAELFSLHGVFISLC